MMICQTRRIRRKWLPISDKCLLVSLQGNSCCLCFFNCLFIPLRLMYSFCSSCFYSPSSSIQSPFTCFSCRLDFSSLSPSPLLSSPLLAFSVVSYVYLLVYTHYPFLSLLPVRGKKGRGDSKFLVSRWISSEER
jgi:hypothetical protein